MCIRYTYILYRPLLHTRTLFVHIQVHLVWLADEHEHVLATLQHGHIICVCLKCKRWGGRQPISWVDISGGGWGE